MFSFLRKPFGPANRDVERAFAFDHLREGLAADGRLQRVLHVGDADVPQGALFAIDGELEIRLALDRKDADAFDARHVLHAAVRTCLASRSSSSRSGPKILIEFSPFTPESVSITLSRISCEKFQLTPGMALSKLALHVVDQLGLGRRARPKHAPPAAARLDDLGPFVLGLSGTRNSAL